jgi:hypothetical protein
MRAGTDAAYPACYMLRFKDRTTSQESFKEPGRLHNVKAACFQPAFIYIYNNVAMTFDPC